jgi:hypothetical protein
MSGRYVNRPKQQENNVMRRNVQESWERRETTASLRFCLSGVQRRAIVALYIVLGATLALALTLYCNPVHSKGQTSATQPLAYPLQDDPPLDTPGNLLTNGNMDLLPFYWRYPNHYIAGGWFEWFSTSLRIPELTNGYERSFAQSKPSSQRLQLWGGSYAGGLIQSATVTPCVYYKLRAFGQSRPGSENPPPIYVDSHMKVGIEPYGWMSNRSLNSYDPGLEYSAFPATVVWSPKESHYFVFTPYTVTTEALSDTVTVILYSRPQVDLKADVWWHDTVWDTVSLVETQPPGGTILPNATIPKADGFITNLSVIAYPYETVIEWDTQEPASTQVIYQLVELKPAVAPPTGSTVLLSPQAYLPFVTRMSSCLHQYSPLDYAPTLHHKVVLQDLPSEYTIDLLGLSRRLDGQACVTSASERVLMVSRDETRVTEE